MTATPMRRPEGLRRILVAFAIWRQLRRAELLLSRSTAARAAGDVARAKRHADEVADILLKTRPQIYPS